MKPITAILAIVVGAVIATGCCAHLASLPPPSSESVTVDLTGAMCRPAGIERRSRAFVTFECITSDSVDLPHIHAGERHSPAVYVRVPIPQAEAFAARHPEPEAARPPVEQNL